MSAKVSSVHDSPAPVEDVFAVLTGPEWADTKAASLNDGSRIIERTEKPDGGVLMVLSRELPAGTPGFLEKFLPQDGRVVTRDDWGPAVDGVRRGTWTVELPGVPARLGGTLLLEPTASGCRYTIGGETKVSIPLVGGKAESFIAGMVTKLAAKEAQVLDEAVAAKG